MSRARSLVVVLAVIVLLADVSVAQRGRSRAGVTRGRIASSRVTRPHPRSRISVNGLNRSRSHPRSRSTFYARYGRYPRNLYSRNLYRPYRSNFYGYRPGFYLQFGYPRFGYPYYGFRRYGIYNYTWPSYIRYYRWGDPFCATPTPILYQGFGNLAGLDTPVVGGGISDDVDLNPNVLNGINVPEISRLLEEHQEKRRRAREVKVMETPEELLTAAMIETNRRRPPSSLAARRKCRESLLVGDRLFGEKKYADALNRYKQASTFAPDIAEAFFRQGHAYLASSRLKLAARSFQRGFDIDPDVTRRGFKLTEIYDDKNPLPKKLHYDDLARTALQQPQAPESYLLIGLMLHYEGEADRAEKFFRRADQLPRRYRFGKLFLPKPAKKSQGIDL